MKKIVLTLAGCLASMFLTASAQDLVSTKRSSTLRTAGAQKQPQQLLKDVLVDLENRYSVHFVYEGALLDNRMVRYEANRQDNIETILRTILDKSLRYRRIDNTLYAIVPANESGQSATPARKPVENQSDLSIKPVFATDIVVTGTVTEQETGQPLPGVSIIVKGTTTGTTTDGSGRYRMTVPEGGTAVLVFSFVGYVPQELPVGSQTTMNVMMQADTKALNEVVVVGYGVQKKRDVTGAIGSINEETIKALPISRFEQSLQGRIAGVNVTSNSGAPGGGVSIRIRGIGTINNNQPLYVIDGIPVFGDNALNSISSNDIQSIEVLKDAAATAIYGARAANGVVIVTTKRGKSGAPSLTYDGYAGVQQLTKRYKMLNAEQYALYSNESRSAQHIEPLTPEWGIPGSIPGGVNTDWQAEIFRQAPIQNHSLTLSGGGERASYVISGNFFDQKGIVKDSEFKRYTLRVNTDAEVFKGVKVGTSLLFARTLTQDDGNAGRIQSALVQLPTVPVQFPNGSWGGPQGPKEYYNDNTNPVAEIALFDSRSNLNRFLGNLFADVSLAKGLTYRASYSVDNIVDNSKSFQPTYRFGVLFRNTASLNQSNGRSLTQVLENILTYNRTFGTKHNLSAVGVYSAQWSNTSSETGAATGLVSNSLPYLSANTGVVTVNSGVSEWAILSLTGRVNYDFAGKYLLSASVRRDGSSRFGTNNRFATFPAFSVGWRLSDEPFMQSLPLFNELKLRGSWGQSGNQEIGLYGFAAALSNTRRYVFGESQTIVPGVAPVSLANPDLRWETATQTNVGLDVGVLNNSVTFSANYYIKQTKDMLVRVPVPQTSGIATAPFVNAGSMENRGVELELAYRKTLNNGFSYQINGNLSTVRNKIVSLGRGQQIFDGSFQAATNGRGGQNVTITRPGDPVGSFYGYVMDGIFQNQSEIAESAVQGTATRPGDIRFRDINGDKKIDANDRIIIGSPIPKLTYGFNGSLNFRGFDLSVFLQGVHGNQLYNGTRSIIAGMFAVYNQTTEVLSRWRGEGTSNTVPRAVQFDPAENGRVSDRWIEDGTYLRLKNLTLGYNLPQNLAGKVKMKNARVYASGTNLLTFTRYTGLDPEVGERSQNALFAGIDQNVYPVTRTITLGLTLGF